MDPQPCPHCGQPKEYVGDDVYLCLECEAASDRVAQLERRVDVLQRQLGQLTEVVRRLVETVHASLLLE